MVIHLKLFGLTAISKLVAHQTACSVVEHFCFTVRDDACLSLNAPRWLLLTLLDTHQSFAERSAVKSVAEIEKMLNNCYGRSWSSFSRNKPYSRTRCSICVCVCDDLRIKLYNFGNTLRLFSSEQLIEREPLIESPLSLRTFQAPSNGLS